MRRRQFITLLGGAAGGWLAVAHAQQTAVPVIAFLGSTSSAGRASFMSAFRQGLKETGFVEGQNVVIEYRWVEGQYNRLPELAAEFVRRPITVIVAPGNAAGHAAKAATNAIPIVFSVGDDPVKLGLVASLNRPGGNATGLSYLTSKLGAKRLGLLHDLVPKATAVAVLVNPNNAVEASMTEEIRSAARIIGLELHVFLAGNSDEIDAAFASLIQRRPGALLTMPDAFYTDRRVQIVTLAARHAVPAIYSTREFVPAGGLMSYGVNIADTYRQVGVYTGRILKGEKPADLPVIQPTRFEFVINLNTAKALGLTVPPPLLAIADEVIE